MTALHCRRKIIDSEAKKADLTVDGSKTRPRRLGHEQRRHGLDRQLGVSGSAASAVDENACKADFTWDGAGRTKSAALTGAEQPRASHTTYAAAWRVVEAKFGEGDASSMTREWARFLRCGANNEVAVTSRSTEDTRSQNWTVDHDTPRQPTYADIDGSSFSFEHHFDESGNVVSSTTPSRGGKTTYDYDARSFTTNSSASRRRILRGPLRLLQYQFRGVLG